VSGALYFTGPGQVEIREDAVPAPGMGQVLLRSLHSAISSGTEMMVYGGYAPEAIEADALIPALAGSFQYPLKYGYCSVCKITHIGPEVDPGWVGQVVFSFQPHQEYSLARLVEIIPIPAQIELENALFLPNMETAVNFLMDGRPLIGETVAVLGQGIVGLLTSALLRRCPIGGMVSWDRYPRRRSESLQLGAALSLDPFNATSGAQARDWLAGHGCPDGFDLVYELSGSPAGLDTAVALAGFAGRVVIGSWYGSRRVNLDLGGRFHRSRIQLVSSQVSTLAPELSGRWTKARRMQTAWNSLAQVRPARWITHRFPFARAAEAYRLLADHPEEALQVVLDYT
jgi:2-desacetyl-2-hydroxyethyl bacteriochlorophyllide A dehydrogenase